MNRNPTRPAPILNLAETSRAWARIAGETLPPSAVEAIEREALAKLRRALEQDREVMAALGATIGSHSHATH